ncbi:MAG: hypothetical protein B7X03_01655 [Parcubacteria group bacterium 21-58-10]|nr:MAG: hypothetical protein B7X03_01655 [Parcubacteria group bacterium 21-58-10]
MVFWTVGFLGTLNAKYILAFMQFPPQKKSTFYLLLVVAILIGIFIGLMIPTYVLLKNKVAFCQASAAVQPLNLGANQSVSGTVVSVSGNQIVLQVSAYDTFNPQAPTTANVSVVVGPSDSIILPQFMSASSTTSLTPSTISNVKAGDVITIKEMANGAKIIYLPIVNK